MKDILSSKKAVILSSVLAVGVHLSVFPAISYAESSTDSPMMFTGARLIAGFNIPDTEENWDDGGSFHLQALFSTNFMPDNYKLAILLGQMNWDVNTDIVALTGDPVSSALSGDIDVVQLGVSVIRTAEFSDTVMGSLESGLVYQNISSDAAMNFTYASGSVISDPINVEDNFALVLGGNLGFQVNESLSFLVGASYQFDTSQSEVTTFGNTIEVDTNAFTVSIGAEFHY